MSDKNAILQSILDQGILPLFYWDSAEVSIEVTRVLYKAGVRALEYTNRGKAALENFRALKMALTIEAPDLYLGIGTIKTADEARAFIEAGADFIVAPIVNPEVAAVAAESDMLWIPGCMTPSEIIKAEELGAMFVKLFPGNLLGPGFMSAIKELFPDLSFMPTGGVEVNKENLSAWFKSGVVAVGMGSKLITKDILEKKDYATLTLKTQEALNLINEVRKG